MKISVFIFCMLLPFFAIAQTFSGKVIDKNTQKPIESASVYFDNTTIGTTTNENGEFSISYGDAVQSTLVISYLGYGKVFISDYRAKNNVIITLVETADTLDEVVINYDDGLTRKQKLKIFRKEFLGTSKFAKSCKILNEDDLILKYSKANKTLYASSKFPVQVLNKALQYKVDFEIIEFEVNFRYVEIERNIFNVAKVIYFGTSFFKDLNDAKTKKTIKNRDRVYKGSVQHFMRSLFNQNLREEGYWIFHKKFRVQEWDYFKVETIVGSDFKKITLKERVSILYNNKKQSELQVDTTEFFIDVFGNYKPVIGVYFSGDMGNQRVGDSLPSDYRLKI